MSEHRARLNLDEVRFNNDSGTVVVVTQCAATGRVLMVANADREALERSIESGEMHYRSRTRGLWRIVAGAAASIWSSLAETIAARREELDAATANATASASSGARPSYTRELLLDRNLRLKKIGEESGELITACADASPVRAAEEAADLIYHVGVALEAVGSSLDTVAKILLERHQRSDHASDPC